MAGFNCLRGRVKWRTILNRVMNFRVSYKAANFLTSRGNVSFAGRAVLHAFSIIVYTSTWQSVAGFVPFISAPGNPPQFVCCRQCNLPAGAHTGSSLHAGDGEVVVSNWRTNYCSLLYEIEGACDSTQIGLCICIVVQYRLLALYTAIPTMTTRSAHHSYIPPPLPSMHIVL